MRQKTIRLDSENYRLTDAGAVEALYPTATGHLFDYEAANFSAEMEKCQTWDWHATRYEIGAQTVLVSRTDVAPNALRAGTRANYYLSFDLDGVPGNSNPKIKRTEGWRGTTSNSCCDAHGVVKIVRIRKLKCGDVSVTVRHA
jgi:hypothetical protein